MRIFIYQTTMPVRHMAHGHGGRRPGAGRKPGGHVREVKALRTEARALLAEIVGTERDPLMIAISIAADESQPTPLRLEAALGAARYLHPTLSAAAVAHVPQAADPQAALNALMDRLGRLAPPETGQVIDLAPEPDPAKAA